MRGTSIEMQSDVEIGDARFVRLSNGVVELLLATSHGPRVARYALCDRPNVFAEVSPREQSVPTPFGDAWHIYGGHRLWSAPEDSVRSYYPDNQPVAVTATERGVTLRQQPEPHTGLEKSIGVTLREASSHVSLLHTLTHHGAEPLELAPWALTAMAPGGVAIFPQASFVPHPEALAPARPLVLWPFTRMNDPRSSWGDRFILLRQDVSRREPQKFGFYNDAGYMAYALPDQLFIKCHTPLPGPHADFGCNAQTFTNELFLELETLGPLITLLPGQSVVHREEWLLQPGFTAPLPEPELTQAMRGVLAGVIAELTSHGCDPRLIAALGQH